MLQHLRRLLIRRPYRMRVDVRRGRRLRMSSTVAHCSQRNPRREQQRDVRVPQRVNRYLRQIGSRNEVVEPTRYAVGVNRGAIILREKSITVGPAVADRNTFLTLPLSELFQHLERLLRQFDRTYGRIRLRAFGEDPLLRQVLRCPANRDHVVFEVDILPF